jgi:hypothetical protein
MLESKEAFEQAPVAVTDPTSPIRSAGTETPNSPDGQLHSIGVLPLELHAVIKSKGTPANALHGFIASRNRRTPCSPSAVGCRFEPGPTWLKIINARGPAQTRC